MAYAHRDSSFGWSQSGSLPSGVKWLLITNVAVFVLYFFAAGTGMEDIFRPLGLVPRSVVESFALWQLVTYMFLHDPNSLWHILLNMLALWMFGMELEGTWGTRRFLQYYFWCGIGSGLIVVAANWVAGTPDIRLIGASGAIYGLLLAFGVLFPNQMVLFAFIFPMKARYFVMILGAIAFLSTIRSPGGPVSHLAHLSGMLFGLAFLKSRGLSKAMRSDPFWRMRKAYRDWQFQRNKRKFNLYLKKKSDQDKWVH